MKTKTRLFLVIAALALGVTTKATSVAPYGRICAEYTKFHTTANFDDFPDWEVGAALECGVMLAGKHSLGIEVSYVESKSIVTDEPIFKTQKQQMPVLLSYRYTHTITNGFSVYGGATAGIMMDKYSLDTTNPLSSGSAINWIPAAGVVAGVNLSIGGGWHVTGGTRVIEVWQKTYKSIGTAGILNLGEQVVYTRPTFTLGFGYKW